MRNKHMDLSNDVKATRLMRPAKGLMPLSPSLEPVWTEVFKASHSPDRPLLSKQTRCREQEIKSSVITDADEKNTSLEKWLSS